MPIRVQGVRRVQQELNAFSRDANRGALKVNVEREVATTIASEIRRRAPRLTGRLRNSIRVVPGAITVGAPYASYLEFGTRYIRAIRFIRSTIRDLNIISRAFGMARNVVNRRVRRIRSLR